jgi:hypothetical protein
MAQTYQRKYGVAATFNFVLFDTAGVNFKTDAAHAAGDTVIMKDEGPEGATTNAFADEGTGYSLVLTATEMTAARIVVYIADQGVKVWLDEALVIETYGHANAQHAFDLDDGNGTTLTEAGGTGDHLTAINLPNQTMDITGDITGNLSGSVGSVTGSVGSVTGAVGSVTNGVTLADDAITAAKFDESTAYPLKSADTGVTAVARTGADADTLETLSDQIDAVPTEAEMNARTLVAANYFDPATDTVVNVTTVSTVTNDVGITQAGADKVWGSAARTLTAISSTLRNQIADNILRRSLASALASADGDVKGFRSLAGAVAKLVNKVSITGATLTVTETDDTTALGAQTVTTDAAADPVTGVDTT